MSQNSTNLNLTLTQVPDDDAVLTGTYINQQSGYPSTSNMQKIDAFAGNIQNTVTNMQGSGYTNQTLKGLDDAVIQTNQKVTYTTTVTGTNTLAGTITELITIQNNLNIFIIPTVANTGAVTLNINTTGALPLVKIQNWTGSTVYAPLEAGDLTPNTPTLIKKSADGLRYIYIGIENSASHVYFKKGTNDYVNLQTKLAALDSTIYEGVLNERDISCGIPQSVTIANATSVIPKFDLNPRVIINGLGSIGNFRKDSNSDGLADGWTGSGAGTYSLSNGEQAFTPTSQFGRFYKNEILSSSRILVLISSVKTTDNTTLPLIFAQSVLASKQHSGSGSFEKIATLISSSAASTDVSPAMTQKTSAFVPITVKQAFYVDVTDYPELVGLTNQQKLDWCLANLEYCDGIGVTKNPTVNITGKNFINIGIGSKTLYGVTFTKKDGVITLNGTASASFGIEITNLIDSGYTNNPIILDSTKQYTLSKSIVSGSWTGSMDWYSDKTQSVDRLFNVSFNSNPTFSSSTGKMYGLNLYMASGAVFNNYSFSVQLEQGTTATTYEPYRESLTTIQGDFLTGDEISILNNKTVGNKLWSSKKTLYGKNYAFVNDSDATGYKVANLPVSTFKDVLSSTLDLLQLPDATQATRVTTITAANQFILTSNGQIKISVADSVTGFGETESVTDDMWRAFFNGWKKTGASTWVSVVDGTTVPTTQSIDFVKANLAPSYDGYWLYYQYTIAKVIDDNSRDYLAPLVGDDINFDKGINTVALVNSIVEGESVSQIIYADATYAYINGATKPMLNKVESFIQVYKNGSPDSNWTYVASYNSVRGNGYMQCLLANYDSSAAYTVDYNILYAIAPQIGSGGFEYKEGLVDGYNNLVDVVNSKQDKHIVLDGFINQTMNTFGQYKNVIYNNPIITTITTGFASGWSGTIVVRKNLNNLIELDTDFVNSVDMVAGVSVVLYTLPVGLRPSTTIELSIFALNTGNEPIIGNQTRLLVLTNGQIIIVPNGTITSARKTGNKTFVYYSA